MKEYSFMSTKECCSFTDAKKHSFLGAMPQYSFASAKLQCSFADVKE